MTRFMSVLAFSTLLFATAPASGGIRTVALSGQRAPGTDDGEVFRSFSARSQSLNDGGLSSFHALLSFKADHGGDAGRDRGIWIERPKGGELQLAVRGGDLVPGDDEDEKFIGFSGSKFGNEGTLSFCAHSFSDQGRRAGIWSKTTDAHPQPVARQFDIAAGTEGARFDGISRMFALANRSGQTAFVGQLDPASPGVTEDNDSGLWVQDRRGVLRLAAREGTAKGLALSASRHEEPLMNDRGEVVFGTIERERGGRRDHILGGNISIVIHGVVFAVVQRDDPIELSPGHVFRLTYSFNPDINNKGEIAFFGGVKEESHKESDSVRAYMVLDPEDVLRVVAASGTQAPGMAPGVKFGFNSAPGPFIGGGGDVVFCSNVGDSRRDYRFGIWAERDRTLGLVAVYGDDAPGTDGAVFGVPELEDGKATNVGAENPFGVLAINANGQIAFSATLSHSLANVTDENDQGIWAEQMDRTLRLIVREGDEIEVAANDVRQVQTLQFVGSTGNEDGRASGFNNRGELAFHAKFTDGSEGIFVSDLVAVPETEKDDEADKEISKTGPSREVDSAEAIERRFKELEQRILAESAQLRQREQNSDGRKLKSIADNLRSKYRDNDAQIQVLRQQLTTSDDLKLVYDMETLIGRQNVLALYWAELATRVPTPLSNVLPPPSTQLMCDAANLMRKYGEDETIRTRIAELMEALYDYKPIRIEQIAADRRARIFGGDAVSAVFAGKIGPEPQPSVIGTTLPESDRGAEDVDRFALASGPVQTLSDDLRRLLKLKWDDSNLIIDRPHWDAQSDLKTQEDIVAEVDQLLRANGVSGDLLTPDEEEGFPRGFPRGLRRGLPSANGPKVSILFDRLLQSAQKQLQPGGFSSGGGGSSGEVRREFSCAAISVEMHVTPDSFNLRIVENELSRMFLVWCGDDGRLKIMVEADQLVFLIKQAPDKKTEVIEITDDDISRVKAKSFKALYRERPEYLETRVFPLLDYFGIITPYTRYNRFVVRSVLAQLQAADVDATKETDELVVALDDDRFEVRQAATKQLQDGYYRYRKAMEAALKNSDLSFEARSRIKRIVADHERLYGDVEQFASSLRLSEDPDFLVQILPKTAETDRSVIVARLNEITGEAFGTDLTAWQAWLKSRQAERTTGH